MAKRNKSRRKRFSQRSYKSTVVHHGKRIRDTRYYLLSEPYKYSQLRRRNTNKIFHKTNYSYRTRLADLSKLKSEYLLRSLHVGRNRPLRNVKRYIKNIVMQQEAIKTLKECTRRKKRREVIFAKKLRGKGSGAKRHRWRPESRIKC